MLSVLPRSLPGAVLLALLGCGDDAAPSSGAAGSGGGETTSSATTSSATVTAGSGGATGSTSSAQSAGSGGGVTTGSGGAAPCRDEGAAPGEILGSNQLGQALDFAPALAVAPDGDVILAGTFHGTLDLGGGDLVADDQDAFVARLSGDGAHVWSERFGGAGDQEAFDVVVDPGGDMIVVGSFHEAVGFGGPELISEGGSDVYVAKLDASGGHVWSRRFGDEAPYQSATSVAVDGEGDLVVGGAFDGTIDLGGESLDSAGNTDGFGARLDTSGGHLWSLRFGDDQLDLPPKLAVDGAGGVVLFGSFSGTINLGGSDLTAEASFDLFLARLDAAGDHVWSRSFGDDENQNAHAFAVDADGSTLITGAFEGTLDLGGPVLTSDGLDGFIARLDASGDHVWSKAFNGVGIGVDVDDEGNLYLVGRFTGSVELGGPPIRDNGGADLFVAKLDPAGGHLWSQRLEDGATVHSGPANIVVARCGGVHVTSYGSSEGAFLTTLAP